jgi:FkbM family methyltransferase
MGAECDVDLIVRDALFSDRKNGVLVEVGAARPDYLSISASYRALGWKIVAIEPNPVLCAAHRALGYDVLQYACSDVDADDVEFFVVDSHGEEYLGGAVSFESYSSLGIKDQYARMYENSQESVKTKIHTIPVKVRKLDSILSEHEPDLGEIDILAVDVEGWELNVIRGLSLKKYRPKVIILENLFKDAKYVAFMRTFGYVFWRHLEPNDVYVRLDLRGLMPTTKFRDIADKFIKRLHGSALMRRVGRLYRLIIPH